MEEHLTWIFRTIFSFLIVSVLIFVGIYFRTQHNVSEIVKVYSESTAISGGFTKDKYAEFLNDLRRVGVDPAECNIKISATDVDGTDISNKAMEVTPQNEEPYPGDAKYCPRGSTIKIEIYSKDNAAISNIFRSLGSNSDIKKVSEKKVYVSERIE